jgi:hypothetical protein
MGLTKTVELRHIGLCLRCRLSDRSCTYAQRAEVQTVPGATSIEPTTNKQSHKAVRPQSDWWFAEPKKLMETSVMQWVTWRARAICEGVEM